MPDDLYGAGANLLMGAAKSVSDSQNRDISRQEIASKESQTMQSNLTAVGMEEMKSRAAMELEKLKTQDKYHVKISPELAVGLGGTLGDPDMFHLGDQDMDQRVLGAIVKLKTEAMKSKMKPKFVTKQEGSDVQRGWSWLDSETGENVFVPVGKGGPKFAPTGAATETLQEKKTWLDNYNKIEKKYEGIKGEIAKSGKSDVFQKDQTFLADNRAKRDTIMRELASSGGSSGNAGNEQDDQFDADSFIDDVMKNSGL